ncbi:DUF4232 domain-containing protein [Pseudonocardia sp. HH130630-07]|uniref:DUF4232 domain-containing protein n=1 Tax=Pseudonocardia sp. HH130630-07 TaxID=1690815 RepID=UPI000814EF26|nr:DUF4232 domain-containing protein [Pseudonocardia sp. HH130630-07]ANY09189.1 hypothetical protein AFB00_26405 [Pseudonocardia sp. HH130630-07]
MDGGQRILGRGARWAATVLACGAVLAGCGSGGSWPDASGSAPEPAPAAGAVAQMPEEPAAAAPAAPAPAQDADRCHTSELAGTAVGDPAGGAAGSSYATLELRNQSGRTCVIRGFPGVSYVGGDDGHQIGPAAAMKGDHGEPVSLAPGAVAGATLRMVNVQNYDPAACAPEPVRGLRVYPPGETDSLFVAMNGTGCSGTPAGDQLVIEAFRTR